MLEFAACLILILSGAQAQKAPEIVANKGLQMQLQKMVDVDQDARNKLIAAMKDPKAVPVDLIRQMEAIDRYNTGQMREIVKTYGWPTSKLVGRSGASNAWLLVQHADLSPKFQRECLDLMTPLLSQGEVDKRNFALLTDRVLLAEGKKQIYGSQFTRTASGAWEPRPIEDPANVDKRRAEMGLEPLAEYKKIIEQVYGTKPPN
jgi:hypothetical protein